MFIKLGGKYFSWEDISLIEDDVESATYPGFTTVRFQYRARQDEVVNQAGRAVHVKHGVYELPPDLSVQFRWFLSTFGAGIGIVDVAERYTRRGEIEQALKVNRESQDGPKPDTRKARVLTMPPFPPEGSL